MQQDGTRDGLDQCLPAALAAGPAPALVDPATGQAIDYDALHELAQRVAQRLLAVGVAPGDRVAAALGNGPAVVVAFLGVLRAGAAFAPLNPAYTAREFETYLRDIAPTAMLLDAETGPARDVCGTLGVAVVDADRDPARDPVPASSAELPDADPDATALVLHTSGTTSAPKAVHLRHRHLAASMETIARGYGLGPADVSYCVMPLFHVHGLVASTLATLASGGTVVVPPRFSARSFWRDVADTGATWFSAVPTIHRSLLLRAAEHDGGPARALRFARSCSSALPPSVWREFEERFEVPLVEAYGMTEAAHQLASNPLPPAERRPGTVGRGSGVDIAILDDAWRPLPAGAAGEVAVRGPSVVDSYHGNAEATEASFRDGWFRTGDRGHLSPDGYLTLEGRIKELINRGGEKISPHEVEDALLSHPQVSEAVAYAIPDEKYGEVVGAVVVATGGDGLDVARLRAHCSNRLAEFKVPARIAVAPQIPKGPTGKVQRRRMAELVDG